MRRCFWIVAASLLVSPIGCGGKPEEASSPSASAVANSANNNPIRSATASTTAVSTVDRSQTIPPQEVVAMFSDSIRRGDSNTSNSLITAAARAEIARRGMSIDPPGSPEASFRIGEVRFLDDDKDAAYVSSLWIEPATESEQTIETEVVWAVQLEPEGWRISGLAIDMGPDLPATIVDFEDLGETLMEDPGQPSTGSSGQIASEFSLPPSDSNTPANSFDGAPNNSTPQISQPLSPGQRFQ